MYITDIDQRDWDEYAEPLTFALNTSYDITRDETPFYLVHGWDARSTLEATLAVGDTSHRDQKTRTRDSAPRSHTVPKRTVLQNEWCKQWFERSRCISQTSTNVIGTNRVKPGYARKLANMWHGPFRVAERVNDVAVRLETAGTPYQLLPIVHVSKLKAVREFPPLPMVQLTIPADERFDFD
ncbi:unnamed protein product [Phytophthora fragariaefolia]|uniref:Unnamed protein product n=1 Tax=Phytophthora fragariaefolia TaxID=1490495 RepID=A0A9W7CZJ0_9STRA|nr:unnamed protein product [Phytophthora fragariaefolia]